MFRSLPTNQGTPAWPRPPAHDHLGQLACRRASVAGAFTLLELLVVMVIIGVLASITLPALKGIGQANLTAAANRQILDDLALARLRAINDRTTVYFVFVPPMSLFQKFEQARNNPAELRSLTNLITGQYTGYALLAARSVGDQPGRWRPHYLLDWKTLPDGMLFAPYQFSPAFQNHPNEYLRSFPTNQFPFPNTESLPFLLPYIAFTPNGQLVTPSDRPRDEMIALAKGSIFYPRDNSGRFTAGEPDVQLSNLGGGTNQFQYIRINWLTGRAEVELPEFK